MPDHPDAQRRRPADEMPGGGIGETAAGALGTLLDYFHARLSLLALEAREARGSFVARIVCGLAACCFLLVGWMALVAGAIGWISKSTDWPWPLVALGLAAVHLFAGCGFLLAARRRFSEPPFRDSLNELEKDRQWLKRP